MNLHRFNALIPELSVSDWRKSRDFYCDLIGFSVVYDRREEGFAFLALGEAQLMIDQIGLGRDFDLPEAPREHPFGRGINLQIEVPALRPVLVRLAAANIPLYLAPEEKWYRRDDKEVGNRQFIVADPDGYLLRFFEDLGERPLNGHPA
ncbi:bleomycin resistance protein [Neorhizobium huautlense]|uniref:bleomycin resistance protein n=1 Tax=Neorhizobium huautlense TaxID=67774 RepID=UPI000CF90494|nr:VOC family protein [Neorhizobium huautlense]